MIQETQELLKSWGQWVRSGGCNTGYSSVRLVMASGPALMPDDQAVKVDRAVAGLKKRDSVMGRAVTHYYVRGWDMSNIGVELGMSREKARMMLRSGEAWVDAALFA